MSALKYLNLSNYWGFEIKMKYKYATSDILIFVLKDKRWYVPNKKLKFEKTARNKQIIANVKDELTEYFYPEEAQRAKIEEYGNQFFTQIAEALIEQEENDAGLFITQDIGDLQVNFGLGYRFNEQSADAKDTIQILEHQIKVLLETNAKLRMKSGTETNSGELTKKLIDEAAVKMTEAAEVEKQKAANEQKVA